MATPKPYPITKIQNTSGNPAQDYYVNLGAKGDNVFITLTNEENNATDTFQMKLSDFVEFVYDYFKDGSFIHYGAATTTPQSNNVKVWYATN